MPLILISFLECGNDSFPHSGHPLETYFGEKRDHEHWMQIEFHIGNEITDQSTRFSDDITN